MCRRVVGRANHGIIRKNRSQPTNLVVTSKATIILARALAIELRIMVLPVVAGDSIVSVHCSRYQQQEGFAPTRLFDKLALRVMQSSWLCKADAVAPVRFRLIERQIRLA